MPHRGRSHQLRFTLGFAVLQIISKAYAGRSGSAPPQRRLDTWAGVAPIERASAGRCQAKQRSAQRSTACRILECSPGVAVLACGGSSWGGDVPGYKGQFRASSDAVERHGCRSLDRQRGALACIVGVLSASVPEPFGVWPLRASLRRAGRSRSGTQVAFHSHPRRASTWCLSLCGSGQLRVPPFCGSKASIRVRGLPIEATRLIQAGQHRTPDPLPYARFFPAPEPAPGGHRRAVRRR